MPGTVRGECFFVASGVTVGPLLDGVKIVDGRVHVYSMALRSDTGTIRYFQTITDTSHLPLG